MQINDPYNTVTDAQGQVSAVALRFDDLNPYSIADAASQLVELLADVSEDSLTYFHTSQSLNPSWYSKQQLADLIRELHDAGPQAGIQTLADVLFDAFGVGRFSETDSTDLAVAREWSWISSALAQSNDRIPLLRRIRGLIE